MHAHREDDQDTRTRFRTERMMEHNGEWFFSTREGTIQGPFTDRYQAEFELNNYIKIMAARSAGELTLQPIKTLI